jgi:NADH-quinone oxidoreductase subunit N
MNVPTPNTWLPSADELHLFSPEFVLVGTIVAVLVVPLLVGRRPEVPALIAVLGCFVGLVATWAVSAQVADGPQAGMVPPSAGATPMLLADRFSVFYQLLLFLALGLITWLWLIGVQKRNGTDSTAERGGPEFFVLLLTSALGMMLMVSSLNLLVLIIAIETASLPSYALVASDKRSRLGAEAALKYVMFGATASAIMIYGVSLLYGRFGTLDLSVIASALDARYAELRSTVATFAPVTHVGVTDAVFWLGLAALGVGIIFKIAAVPMHYWCPDVFQGAPTEVTTWLSVASKAAGVGLLLRIVSLFTVTGPWPPPNLPPAVAGHTYAMTVAVLVGILAAVTCTVGNLAALRQENVKRILAYSSIAHAGYMMMAAAIIAAPSAASGVSAPTYNAGMAAVIAYLFVYLLMNVGAFGATALVVWQTGTDHLSAFTGLGRRAPWVALPLAVCLFSLVGLPPLGGFTAKWYLLLALGKSAATQPWLWVLVVVAVINTAISLYYYVRIIRQMYLRDDAALPAFRPPGGGVALVSACAIILLLLGTLWFSPLGRRAQALASDVYARPPAAHAELSHPM